MLVAAFCRNELLRCLILPRGPAVISRIMQSSRWQNAIAGTLESVRYPGVVIDAIHFAKLALVAA